MSQVASRLLGVVLNGGRSRRMGRNKADLKTASGASFFEVACRRLSNICDAVAVSTAYCGSPPAIGAPYLCIADPPVAHGPVSGLCTALEFATREGFDACVFTPVDTPDLTTGDVDRLLVAFRQHPGTIVCAVAGESASLVEPLIAVYPIVFAAPIRDAIAAGEYSPQRILLNLPVVRVPLSASACRNVNTPSELEHTPHHE
jgi:molybdopterin-guanine dinucleotide biosynthesis protein A